MSKAGQFELRVWQGGRPIWCEIYYDGKRLEQFNALELADLAYAVKKARREAREVARTMDKERVEEY